ncbi:type I secretion system permease/ATPase [Xinfangfangia sp. CPCC 101601]|uniref:Type I secretion system permease/ATPase n=1 Tax=Pseudogemmobacter lacusdianii TaxID=3069608 RepID=A0ABU0VYN2_9RHOB|nr:type I secretion system permease/ATPase [Xinfangfangia sp. CPCC 101601]MDQ2066866.1 type I secretion system permease/ATPase [Xinfangfangia sp. CPCC 101601]
MKSAETNRGVLEIRALRRRSHRALFAVMIFSIFVNLLMLTAPLYMLQVYDRVLISRSEETLLALSGLVAFLFLAMGLLDHARSRVAVRVGARLQDELDHRVLSAAFRKLAVTPQDVAAHSAQRDLEAMARIWSSPALMALFDLPWTPIFAAVIFIFHPILGWTAVAGMVVLVGTTLLSQSLTEAPVAEAVASGQQADRQADNLKSESELIRALGMTRAAFQRWQTLRNRAARQSLAVADTAGAFATGTRSFRLFLQSAILGIGAWLVLRNELSAGAMIAGSILMGRALQPIEILASQWPSLTSARQAQRRVEGLLAQVPAEKQRTPLPRPAAKLELRNVMLTAPGEPRPVLRGLNLTLEPGQALGVIGPSGSGKSSLARALIGAWAPASGTIRLDGATLDQYDPDTLGRYIGYLPQRVTLFDGTIAENIARLDAQADPAAIVAAAEAAAAHELIKALPQGYDTQVASMGSRLSGGQVQRIGLARALYGDPVFLVLDEPNSNLDNDGSNALNTAIRTAKAKGHSVLIMAHRPAAIQECDLLMVLHDGAAVAFGPRDQVLRGMVSNAQEITRSATKGGVV